MPIINKLIEIETKPKINIYNITPQIEDFLASKSIKNGQVLVFSRHTTTALAINENEVRLLEDIKVFLQKLAPDSDSYLHNDLHLRDVPEDEPINAHSHLMAMMLTTSEIIPIVDGKLALGTWQSVLFFELDGRAKERYLSKFLANNATSHLQSSQNNPNLRELRTRLTSASVEFTYSN